MNVRMTKPELMTALGFTTQQQLADFYEITLQAVSQWSEDDPIPEAREWEARARRPEVFGRRKPKAA